MLFLCMLLFGFSSDIAEQDIEIMHPADVPYARYLSLENVEEKEREHYMAVVSHVLNSLSTKKTIKRPVFVDKNKVIIRFDLRDYGLDVAAYDEIKVDPYTKKSKKLEKFTKSKNPLIRADWFIIKATTAPTYYKLIGVSNLEDFRKRHGDDGAAKRVRAEQAAVVILSGLAKNTRYVKRVPTPAGVLWEARDSASINYLTDLLSDKYDSIQLLASNPNGLLSYYAADSKGKAVDFLPPEISFDHSKSFEPDLLVRVARNCFACHNVGILPIDDSIRKLAKKDVAIVGPNRDIIDRISDLFGGELPVKKDQDSYKEALLKATGMEPKEFTRKFILVWTNYYADLTLEKAAMEIGKTPEEFKKECLLSKDARLLRLIVEGKISRMYFEDILQNR